MIADPCEIIGDNLACDKDLFSGSELPGPSARAVSSDTEDSHSHTESIPGNDQRMENESNEDDIKQEILFEVLKTFHLTDQLCGSQNVCNDLLEFAKELFSRNKDELIKQWPTGFDSGLKLVEELGYCTPKTYYILYDNPPVDLRISWWTQIQEWFR